MGRNGLTAGAPAAARTALGSRVYATVVTPKQLTVFHQCPLWHHLQFRRKLRGAIPPNAPPLAEGNALHAVMRRWFRRDPDRRAASDPAIVDGWLDEALAHEPYADTRADDPDARDRALHRLAGHAGWCLGQIPDDVDVRAAERDFQTGPLRLGGGMGADRGPGQDPIRFQARLDLLVSHSDGELEHIDFKTGAPRATHWIHRGVERLVAGHGHPVEATPGGHPAPGRPPTRTTTLYAGHRQVESICHTPETFRSTRSDLRDLTLRMLATPPGHAAPDPTPAGHCAWCPYRETACPVHRRQDGPHGRHPSVGESLGAPGRAAAIAARR